MFDKYDASLFMQVDVLKLHEHALRVDGRSGRYSGPLYNYRTGSSAIGIHANSGFSRLFSILHVTHAGELAVTLLSDNRGIEDAILLYSL